MRPSGFWIALALAVPGTANATITIDPEGGYALDSGNKVFYGHDPAGTQIYDTDFRGFDFTQNITTDSSSRPNRVDLAIKTNLSISVSGSQVRVVTFVLESSTIGTFFNVPIASVNGVDCSSSSLCQVSTVSSVDFTSPRNLRFAAQIGDLEEITVGVYLDDLCFGMDLLAGANIPAACETDGSGNGKFKAPTAGSPLTYNLKAFISVAADTASLGSATSTDEQLNFKIVVQNGGVSSVSCTDVSAVYFPGDGEIFVSTSQFTATTAAGTQVPTLIIAADESGTVVTGSSFASSNDIVSRLPLDGLQRAVGGFTNTTTGSDHQYAVSFAARDAAGVVSSFGCPVTGVMTAEIQGLLRSSNCFIATAAFGDGEAIPVLWLRAFRDAVLERHSLGRAFVRWYYAWSPGAAAWLEARPWLRPPVLLALGPIQLGAWLALRPSVAAAALLLALAIAGCFCMRGRPLAKETGP